MLDQADGTADVAVVGAGIVGLAVARELLGRHPRLNVVVVDKEREVGAHQSSHNSGVVHAGIYYAPGSLKARLCVDGMRRLYDYCEQHGIAHERVGKVIVATSAQQLGALDELERRGRANEVPGLRRVDRTGLRALEPEAAGVEALHSPETGIVDFPAVARRYAEDVRERGGTIALGTEVTGVAQPTSTTIALRHAAGELRARALVSCAGGWADRLAVRAGADPDPRIVPFRGAYLRLREDRRHLVRSLIYPVPDPELPFLGVHLSRHISGDVWVGPSAVLAFARDGYRLADVRPRDLAQTLAWPGSLRMFRRWWRVGLAEMACAVSTGAYVRLARRLLPALRDDDVLPGPSGVRAQAVGRDGRLVDDFVVHRTPRAIHVRNAPSPAATSSLALGELIASEAERAFDLVG